MTPDRVNRAHWPTKENRQHSLIFLFFGPLKNRPEMIPNGARSFFPTNLDLANILGRTDFDFDIFYLFVQAPSLARAEPEIEW